MMSALPDFAEAANCVPEVFLRLATEGTGLTDFGDDAFREPLSLVAAGLRQDTMSKGGRRMLGRDVVKYLSNRLRVVDYHRQHPHLADAPIEAPIVILGLPRTGTTAMSYLLDQDPQWRSLLNWEAVTSVPPATSATLRTDPRCVELLEFQEAVLPAIDPSPPHWEWADGPTECTFVLAQDFKAGMWESRVPNPAYRDYISGADMTSAYAYHRMVLQVLQSEAPGSWVLKMPAHGYFIDGLLAEYPDARIIWTHRDPATCAASFMNLTAFAHTLSLGAPDLDWIRSTLPQRLLDQVTRPMAALANHPQVHHVHYADYIAEPLDAVEGVYDWLGQPLPAEARMAMEAWLARDPLSASRKAAYAIEDFGLTRAEVHNLFSNYIEAFEVAVTR